MIAWATRRTFRSGTVSVTLAAGFTKPLEGETQIDHADGIAATVRAEPAFLRLKKSSSGTGRWEGLVKPSMVGACLVFCASALSGCSQPVNSSVANIEVVAWLVHRPRRLSVRMPVLPAQVRTPVRLAERPAGRTCQDEPRPSSPWRSACRLHHSTAA